MTRRPPISSGAARASDVRLRQACTADEAVHARQTERFSWRDDDDMRAVYALSALLRGKGEEVVVPDTGREALRVLDQHPNVQLVLMDIMMPDMDGYETMRTLRAEPRFADLPVIALTAKAMKGEGERCQAAGASDYMVNPVDAMPSARCT